MNIEFVERSEGADGWMDTGIRLERELFLVPIPSYLDHSKVAEFQLFTEYICGIPTLVMFGNCGYLDSQ